MEKVEFLIWMLCFPVSTSLAEYFLYSCGKHEHGDFSVAVQGFTAFVELVIYFGVAILLWQNT